MNIKETRNLDVTVDKRHIISIGERLYAESIELLRELINNAYDADASEVRVEIHPDKIAVRDNGSGMDEDGLKQYFVIGSDEKLMRSVSPRTAGRESVSSESESSPPWQPPQGSKWLPGMKSLQRASFSTKRPGRKQKDPGIFRAISLSPNQRWGMGRRSSCLS